jgi:hypothetical protein
MMRFLPAMIGMVLGILLPETAWLQSLPPPPCTYPGCGGAPKNLILEAAIPAIGIILLNTAVGLSVLFTVIGGARYLISLGRDDEYNKGKQTILWALGGLVVALTSHRIVVMIISEQYVQGLGTSGDPVLDLVTSMVRILTTMLNAVFLIVVIGSGFRIVMARGKEEEVTKGRHGFLYAIAGAIMINVAPFVVRAVLNI